MLDELRAAKAPTPMTGPDYVFPTIAPTPDGRERAGKLTKAFKVAARRAGLGHLHLHKLRHAYGHALSRENVDRATMSALLGHSNPEVTWRYASAIPTDAKTAAVQRLAAARGQVIASDAAAAR